MIKGYMKASLSALFKQLITDIFYVVFLQFFDENKETSLLLGTECFSFECRKLIGFSSTTLHQLWRARHRFPALHEITLNFDWLSGYVMVSCGYVSVLCDLGITILDWKPLYGFNLFAYAKSVLTRKLTERTRCVFNLIHLCFRKC